MTVRTQIRRLFAQEQIWRLLAQENVNFLLTNRVPRAALTRFMGWFSLIEQPLVRNLSIAVWRLFCDVDLSELARHFGGGGHAAAAGFSVAEVKRAPAERLAALLGSQLEHQER